MAIQSIGPIANPVRTTLQGRYPVVEEYESGNEGSAVGKRKHTHAYGAVYIACASRNRARRE